jgi:hypothetical protein
MDQAGDVAREAATALSRLVLDRIVLSYSVGLQAGRFVVTARISAQDELARARAKRRVQAALNLVSEGVAVVIESAPPSVPVRG